MLRRNLVIKGRHLTTKHVEGAKLNDVNPGVYWQALCFAWGYYRNSHTTKERVLISRWFCLAIPWNGVTYSAGVVSGYPDSWLLPMMMKSEVMRVGQHRFRIFFIPQTFINKAAIHGSIETSVSFSEFWPHWKTGVCRLVKSMWGKKKTVSLDDAPTEFHDSCVADFVNLEGVSNNAESSTAS